jgi:hypothetical protein
MDSRVASIELFYRRIGIIVNAFQVSTISAAVTADMGNSDWPRFQQISGLLSIQTMMGKNEKARNEDIKVLNTQLKSLGQSQVQLRKTLGS